MIKAQEVEIRGSKYTITQMTARKAIRMQAKLVKLLGPAFAELINGIREHGVEKADIALPKTLMYLTSQLDDKTLEAIIIELTEGVRKSGIELTPAILDMEFAGELDTLYRLLFEIVKVNFSDFFAEGGIMQILITAWKSSKPVSPESNATSLQN